jgi:hypothetical protein
MDVITVKIKTMANNFEWKKFKKEVVRNRKWIKKPCGPNGPSLEFISEEDSLSYTNKKFFKKATSITTRIAG